MTITDIFKAAGVALLLLVINIVIAILAVTFYSFAIEPGHPQEFYDAAAQRIVPWVIHIVSPILFFTTGYIFGKRRPKLRALMFAAVMSLFYAIIDAAMVRFKGTLSVGFIVSMLANLLAAVGAAYLAVRRAN